MILHLRSFEITSNRIANFKIHIIRFDLRYNPSQTIKSFKPRTTATLQRKLFNYYVENNEQD